MPKTWAAGFNRPGYMPDGDPGEFDDFGEAVQYLVEELERLAEVESEHDREEQADACDALSWELANNAPANREWAGTAAGWEWWIKESAE